MEIWGKKEREGKVQRENKRKIEEDRGRLRGMDVQQREDNKCKRELAHGSKGDVPTEKEPCWV